MKKQDVFRNIINVSRGLLQNYPEAVECQEYLDGRINRETQEKFEIGYFPNMKNITILTSLINEKDLIENYILFMKEIEDSLYPRRFLSSYFEHHPVIMPFKNVYGEVAGLLGRSLFNDQKLEELSIKKYKYNLNFGKTNHLFGLFENQNDILKKDCVYVVEGQFDVIKAWENGLTNVVAVGSCYMSVNQFALLCRFTDNIIVLFDNDEAGERGRIKLKEKYGNWANIDCKWYLPLGVKDLDEYFKKNPNDDLELEKR